MNGPEKRWKLQLTLGNLLLLIAAVAAVFANIRASQRLRSARATVNNLRPIARELLVEDETEIAVVTRMPTRYGELIFDVFIPESPETSGSHELALACDEIEGRREDSSYPRPDQTVPIGPGRHSIEIRHEKQNADRKSDPGHRVQILLDDAVVIRQSRPAQWQSGSGWSSSGPLKKTETYDPGRPVELHRRRFYRPTPTGSSTPPADEAAHGILLWIQPPGRARAAPEMPFD